MAIDGSGRNHTERMNMASDTQVTHTGCGFRIDLFPARQRDVIRRALEMIDMEIRTKSDDLEHLLKRRDQLATAIRRVGNASADDRAGETDVMHANHMEDVAQELDRQSYEQLNGGR
ncbi:MAG: hypothetical protein ACTHLZ_17815 [Tepidisphaeraceae bacterium]